ncbi:hypothetical protein MD484_g8603, partial [Candolleomyces efflorescens]
MANNNNNERQVMAMGDNLGVAQIEGEELRMLREEIDRLHRMEEEYLKLQSANEELRKQLTEQEDNLRAFATQTIDVFAHVHYAWGEISRAQQQTSWRMVRVGCQVLRRAKMAIARLTHQYGDMLLDA